jgi:Nucleotidyltransferase domain
MPLPQAVSALVTDRLRAVDAALPGFVTALWVTGSAASGDWRPDRSDVDFVAATSRVPDLTDLEALAALHAGGGEIHYDGLYVPAADLPAPPSAEESAAHAGRRGRALHHGRRAGRGCAGPGRGVSRRVGRLAPGPSSGSQRRRC